MSKQDSDYPTEDNVAHAPDTERVPEEQLHEPATDAGVDRGMEPASPAGKRTAATNSAGPVVPPKDDDDSNKYGSEQGFDDAEEEKRAIAALEATLPRPDWYSSDDDSSDGDDVIEDEINEFKINPEGGFMTSLIYTVLVFIAFAFNLSATCPVPWFRAKHGGRTYGIWRAKGGGLPDSLVTEITDCSNEMQLWQATAVFSVFATCASFGALVSGILYTFGKGHLGACFILSFYGMCYSLTSWALSVTLFNFNGCKKGKYSAYTRLDAGFAITLIAFVMCLFASLVLLVHFRTHYTRSVHAGIMKPMRFIYMIGVIIVMIFNCVGPAMTLWSKNFPLVKAKVTMWHVEIEDKTTGLSTYLGRNRYKCKTYTERMKTVAAFNIMSNIWLFFSVLFGVAACFVAKFRKNATFFGMVAMLFMLIEWVILVTMKLRKICKVEVLPGQSLWNDMDYNGIPTGVYRGIIRYNGYAYKEGFILMVTAWALQLVLVIGNMIM